ncbi:MULTISPECIES: hypothetical protein [unclassified Fibrobacter]|uniref:hypothetical protein n=1 Tax=unclassified Fibrobacter TaxID=2634177 RepID=UPI000D793BB2|nr:MULTISPECIES: hypothetical protein [unclassified Fibrobacter]PWJ68140.1 hypothetical protein BGX12_11066 [Fibrobacter sp. UWR4]PZW71875.1 hypothetical protein C8E88_100967 [Fibrobacter sp. UWR1]
MSKVKLKCDKCGRAFDVDVQYTLDDSNERSMGEEKIRKADIDVKCPSCGNLISGCIKYWEYPPGMIDYKDDSHLEGGNVEDYGVGHGLN